jgi:hypothetical protein
MKLADFVTNREDQLVQKVNLVSISGQTMVVIVVVVF